MVKVGPLESLERDSCRDGGECRVQLRELSIARHRNVSSGVVWRSMTTHVRSNNYHLESFRMVFGQI